MHHLHHFTRIATDRIEALLCRMHLVELATARPVVVAIDDMATQRLVGNLRAARRAHSSNLAALRSTDALLEQLYH